MSNQVGDKFLNKIKCIDLFVTEECNLNCTYCFHTKDQVVLSIEQGKKIIDRLHELSPESFKITFFGGEPLLYPETVLQLALYAREKWGYDEKGKPKTAFAITTNATYYDEEMFKKYRDLGFTFMVSIDGDEITNNENRPGDFKLITDNIKKMVKFLPDVQARMTYTPKTVGRLAINVQFIHEELGINTILHQAVIEDNWTEDSLKIYKYQLNQLYHYRRFKLRQNSKLSIVWIDKVLKILNDEVPSEFTFCEAGKSYIGVMANGDVYPCHRAASSKIFKLGNIFDEIPFIRGMFLNIDKEYVGCSKNCEAFRSCHSCIITNYKVNKELTKPVTSYCNICKAEYELARSYMPVELNDRQERLTNFMASMLVELSKQNEEILERIKNDNRTG